MAIIRYFANGRHVDFGLYADVPFVPVGAQVKGGAAVEAIAVASASGVGRGASYLLQVLRIIIEVGGRACHNVVRPYGEGVFYGVQLQMDRERDFPVAGYVGIVHDGHLPGCRFAVAPCFDDEAAAVIRLFSGTGFCDSAVCLVGDDFQW